MLRVACSASIKARSFIIENMSISLTSHEMQGLALFVIDQLRSQLSQMFNFYEYDSLEFIYYGVMK